MGEVQEDPLVQAVIDVLEMGLPVKPCIVRGCGRKKARNTIKEVGGIRGLCNVHYKEHKKVFQEIKKKVEA